LSKVISPLPLGERVGVRGNFKYFWLNFSEDFFSELQAVTSLEAVVILKRLISPLKDLLLDFVILLVE
jgi:hypothetical protein